MTVLSEITTDPNQLDFHGWIQSDRGGYNIREKQDSDIQFANPIVQDMLTQLAGRIAASASESVDDVEFKS